jgi:hypothetical protein
MDEIAGINRMGMSINARDEEELEKWRKKSINREGESTERGTGARGATIYRFIA